MRKYRHWGPGIQQRSVKESGRPQAGGELHREKWAGHVWRQGRLPPLGEAGRCYWTLAGRSRALLATLQRTGELYHKHSLALNVRTAEGDSPAQSQACRHALELPRPFSGEKGRPRDLTPTS